MTQALDLSHAVTPGLLRRLAAILYDAVLLFGVLVVAATLVVLPLGLILGAERWQALSEAPAFRLFLQAVLVAVAVSFHVGFWTRGGQSLGMRAWRLRVVREDGLPLTVRDGLVRYLAAVLSLAACGLGFLWVLIDREGRAWHDRLSRTRLVLMTKAGDSS